MFDLIRKSYDSEIKVDEKLMCATGILCRETKDLEGDVIRVKGVSLEQHKRNPLALWNHGLKYDLPIGKCEDPNGQYTVMLGEGEILQTTYFDQKSAFAADVFNLYAQKILRANSIGIITVRKAKLPGGRFDVLESVLLEATWCSLPINPDAVRSVLGKVQDLQLKALLEEQLPPAPATIYVPRALEKSCMKPYGAKALKALHEHLADVHTEHTKALGAIDNDKVKPVMEASLKAIEETMDSIRESHDDIYPDQDFDEQPEVTEKAVDPNSVLSVDAVKEYTDLKRKVSQLKFAAKRRLGV